jgi:hypothetical protein
VDPLNIKAVIRLWLHIVGDEVNDVVLRGCVGGRVDTVEGGGLEQRLAWRVYLL